MPLQKDYNPDVLSDQELAVKDTVYQFRIYKVKEPLDVPLPTSILEDNADGPSLSSSDGFSPSKPKSLPRRKSGIDRKKNFFFFQDYLKLTETSKLVSFRCLHNLVVFRSSHRSSTYTNSLAALKSSSVYIIWQLQDLVPVPAHTLIPEQL